MGTEEWDLKETTMPKLDSLKELYVDQLRDLYNAEQQLTKALPQMEQAAQSNDLKKLFREHLKQTEQQVERLERIFKELGTAAKGTTCEGMKGLIKEGEEYLEVKGNPNVKDAAIIAAAQRVEHYEIAGYGTAKAFAERLDLDDQVRLLDETLKEEHQADEKLNKVALGEVNKKAMKA